MMIFCAAFCSLATAELPPPLPPPSLPPPSAPYYEVNSKEQLLDIFNESRMEANVNVVVASGTIIELHEELKCQGEVSVAIRGSGEGAIIDGQGITRLFYVSGSCSLTLERLNLKNGHAVMPWPSKEDKGGAVYANYDDGHEDYCADYCDDEEDLDEVFVCEEACMKMPPGSITLINTNVSNCSATEHGGAVYLKGGGLDVIHSVISGCRAGEYGGAIFIASGRASLDSSSIIDCHASHAGGAMYVGESGSSDSALSLVTRFTSIVDCSADYYGGAVSVSSGALSLDDTSVVRCHTKFKGGAMQVSSGIANITNSIISDCYSGLFGGALFVEAGEVNVVNAEISDCYSKELGGAMYVASGSASLARSTISNCTAAEYGGGLYSAGGSTSLSDGTLISGCSARSGGGLYSGGGSTSLSDRTLISGCSAKEGRSIYLAGKVSYTLPAPAGRWLPNARCEVYREACPTDDLGRPNKACVEHRDNCALTLDTKSEWDCQAPTFVQPCNWNNETGGDPSLLGENLYQLPLEHIERDFPYRCAAGLNVSLDPESQSSSLCAGPCPPGTSSAIGSGSCTDCEPGFYARQERQAECRRCQHPLSSGNRSVICSICKEDYYLSNSSADPYDIVENPTEHCQPCPRNASCSAGTALESILVPPGYWRASPFSTVLYECGRFGGGDDARKTRCAGGPEAGSKGDGYCATNFTGPECQLCTDGPEKRYLIDGDTCEECPKLGAAMGKLVGLALGVCVACGLAAWAYSVQSGRQSWREKPCVGPSLRLADRAAVYYVGIGATAKIKILVGFLQMSFVLVSTYSARLPELLARRVGINEALAFDAWCEAFLLPQCFSYSTRLLVVAFTPIALIAIFLLVGIGVRVRRWLVSTASRPTCTEAVDTVMRGMFDLTPAALVLVFCFVPSISAAIFRTWSCQAYTISPPNEPLRQVYYMRQDARVECVTEDHESIEFLAYFLIVIWPLGSLLLYGSLLIPCYKPLHAKSPTALTRATVFLHREYELTFYWWEALELARKLTLMGAVLLIEEQRAFLRLLVATVICSVYAVGLAIVRPYKRVEDTLLAVAASLVLLLSFLCANWTTIFIKVEERKACGDDYATELLGFSDVDKIGYAMIGLAAVAVFFAFVGGLVALRRFWRVPTIRLASTRQAPELTLATGMTYHIFNSHIWSTGQDAVAVIKKELLLLLPGINVFLDVDNLDDIGALEEYIRRSQTILFFLSRGYFRSQNCLREVRASLAGNKPIVLVQEADPDKGGGTLEDLRAECPESLQPPIFDVDWPLIVWLRIDDFRLLSLKLIAEALLLCTPAYAREASLPIYLPGELLGQNLTFAAQPVVLWASPANPGAKALADELADICPSGLTVAFSAEAPESATHMLLYLNLDTWSDERLAEQVKQAREDELPIVMAHENDLDRGGCLFAKFFETTPQELIEGDLYSDLARSCFSGVHREVSLMLLAKELGATRQGSSVGWTASPAAFLSAVKGITCCSGGRGDFDLVAASSRGSLSEARSGALSAGEASTSALGGEV